MRQQLEAVPVALTALEGFAPAGDGPLLLGRWCARGPFADREVLPDPWLSGERFEAALVYCEGAADRIMNALAEHLDRAVGLSRSRRYWRIIVYPWLIYHLQQMYDHYVHLEEAFKREPSLTTIVMDPVSYRTPRDNAEFSNLVVDDPYNLQCFSQLLEGRGFPAKRFDAWRIGQSGHRTSSPLKEALKRGVERLLILAPKATGAVLLSEMHLRRAEIFRLLAGSRLKALPFWGELPRELPPADPASPARRGLASLPAADEFEKRFIAALPVNLPSLYLEGHLAARKHLLPRLPRRPRVLCTAVGWHYEEPFKFAAAEWAEQGTKLWGFQHGGGYGYMRQTDAERLERQESDRFHTWGWAALDGDARLRDLPAPQISRARRRSAGRGLLLVSISLDCHCIRLVRATNGALGLDYIDRQARFWKSLPPVLQAQSALRLYTKDWGWGHQRRLLELCPDLRLEDPSRPFWQSLSSTRLMIFDYPSTTFLEALGADVPSILTWNPAAHDYRPSAAPFFDALKRVGILFDEPEQAAAKAAEVYDRAGDWWNEPGRRKVHREFSHYFARASRDWLKEWLGALKEA